VTLSTPERAASAVGKRPRVELTLWLPNKGFHLTAAARLQVKPEALGRREG